MANRSQRTGSRDGTRDRTCELQVSDPQLKIQTMSSRQLEQLRDTLDSIVEDLCNREQAVDKEQAHLLERLNQLDQRQTELKSLEEIISVHQATETELADQLRSLIKTLEQRAAAQPTWITSAFNDLEARLTERLAAQLPHTVPSLEETVRELEKSQRRVLGELTEQMTASLQTALAVQLAPVSDDLPAQLQSIVSETVAAAVPSSSAPLTLSMPELAREIEKFESKSMASMAARMSAGLQSTLATALSTQWANLAAELPSLIAQAVPPLAAATPARSVSLAAEPGHSSSQASDQALAEQTQRIEQLTQQLADTQTTLTETEALLANALATCSQPTPSESSTPIDDPLVEALRTEVNELRGLLSAKERDSALVEELRQEIHRLRSANPDAAGDQQDAELRERLELASCEIIDLRSQNEELSERIARLQINYTSHGPTPHLGQEGLCWEERKRLLLQQLNAESEQPDTAETQSNRLAIEEVIKTTDAELARRDREISELRSLLQQQSAAHEGMAVGAAAVAQIIESDELVQHEREKLRTLQKTWDEKLRQAEIDLSMERAKLARERLQLEEQKQELEQALHAAHAEAGDPKDKAPDAKGRKWLNRLGLKEDN